MRHIFPPNAYSDAPRKDCWWDHTCARSDFEPLDSDVHVDVAIIGGGFTGLNAALTLADAGASVAIFEANRIGWGASGRNGGFCCLGGGTASDALLDRKFGTSGRLAFRHAEVDAVRYVEALLGTLALDVDRHSKGETIVAHRPKDMRGFEAEAPRIEENYGIAPSLIGAGDLAAHGMAGPFFGGMTTPIGFALNPLKYVRGLADAAALRGVRIFEGADVSNLRATQGRWQLEVGAHRIRAEQVVLATNGYSSETVPPWLAARYLPVQSNVIVTRPLTPAEIASQGWHSDQMVYDSRNLLHYFRLMPDRRMLFGLRGGIGAGPAAQARATAAAKRDFRKMFPTWSDVDITHSWSGMVAMARSQTPFVGAVPDAPGLWAAMCYHGNGVAMGSFAGARLGALMCGQISTQDLPDAMTQPLARFPLGAMRRAMMPALYAGLALADL